MLIMCGPSRPTRTIFSSLPVPSEQNNSVLMCFIQENSLSTSALATGTLNINWTSSRISLKSWSELDDEEISLHVRMYFAVISNKYCLVKHAFKSCHLSRSSTLLRSNLAYLNSVSKQSFNAITRYLQTQSQFFLLDLNVPSLHSTGSDT